MFFDTITYYATVALALYKALAVIIIVISVTGIVYIVVKSSEIRRSKFSAKPPADENLFSVRTGNTTNPSAQQITLLRDTTITRWHDIVERLSAKDQKDFKSAIIEADALADEALRMHGFEGETMAHRMQAVPRGRFSTMEDLWYAHKIRNAIAHDPHYIISPREGHDIMRKYKKILDEFGTL